MISALNLHGFDLGAVARLSALRIVDSLLEGTVIAIFAVLLVRAHRRHNAGTRFALWFSALMAVAVMPLVSGWLSSASPKLSSLALHRPAITVPDSWALYLFAAWALIAGWFLLGVARSLWHLRALRKTCVPLDPAGSSPELQETLQRAQINRRATLCLSDQVRVPTVLGLWKPAIVFPRWIVDELSPAELHQILLHELAHLRRYDDWTNLAQQLVRALFFFHPAVWWIESRISLEREIACDDAVVAATQSARSYAECLAHLAEKSFLQRSVALAQAALGKMRQMSTRVARVLDSDRSIKSVPYWKTAITLVAGFVLVCAVSVSTDHSLIAFQPTGPQAVATNAVAPPFPRSLREGGHSSSRAASIIAESNPLSATAPVVPANWKFSPAQHPAGIRHNAIAQLSTSAKKILPKKQDRSVPNSLVRLTSFGSAAIPSAETVFVLIYTEPIDTEHVCLDQPAQAQPAVHIWQIQMWHFLIFHPPADQTAKPQKET